MAPLPFWLLCRIGRHFLAQRVVNRGQHSHNLLSQHSESTHCHHLANSLYPSNFHRCTQRQTPGASERNSSWGDASFPHHPPRCGTTGTVNQCAKLFTHTCGQGRTAKKLCRRTRTAAPRYRPIATDERGLSMRHTTSTVGHPRPYSPLQPLCHLMTSMHDLLF